MDSIALKEQFRFDHRRSLLLTMLMSERLHGSFPDEEVEVCKCAAEIGHPSIVGNTYMLGVSRRLDKRPTTST